MENKKNNKFLISIILILILLLGGCIVLLFQEKNNSKVEKEKTEKIEKDKKSEPEPTPVELTPEIESTAKGLIPKYLCGGLALDLKEENKTIDSFTPEEKLKMIIYLKSGEILGAMDSTYSFKEEELYKYFEDISFMEAFKPAIDSCHNISGLACHSDAKVKETLLPLYMKYENGSYTIEPYGTGCTGPSNDGYYLSFENSKSEKSNLVLRYLRYYLKTDYDDSTDTFISKYYKDESRSEVLFESKNGEQPKFDSNKYDHYEFVYDISNNNVRLTNINYLNN